MNLYSDTFDFEKFYNETKDDDMYSIVFNLVEDIQCLKEERDQLKALLNEHLIEWEKDSGEWDEFNWIDRVSVAIDSRLRQKAQEVK